MKKAVIITVLSILSTSTILAQNWLTDFSVAKALASKENKPIILVFQGSDWCGPCIKLDREIWTTKEFKAFANNNYVMLKADFPRKKKNELSLAQKEANAKLAERYNKNGIFPFVVVLDENGTKLGETGYKKTSPDNYIKELNSMIN
ncbi:thioredoxin family protein [Winogradskyella sp. A2]|uniref:thioredoxin family protein n=1 Tax=Winogradskyella sp. A2 TaxID=3366944 RepID=UPI00398C3FB0